MVNHCWTLICLLKLFLGGLRLFSDVWSENAALFKRLMKFIQILFINLFIQYYIMTLIKWKILNNLFFQSSILFTPILYYGFKKCPLRFNQMLLAVLAPPDFICILYHSNQNCPIDFHMLHSELFHDHEIVPQLFHGFLCVSCPFT